MESKTDLLGNLGCRLMAAYLLSYIIDLWYLYYNYIMYVHVVQPLPFFVVYSMSSSCNWQITLRPCLHVFYSTSDQFILGFDSYMSTMAIFPDKLFSRLFQDYNPSTSNLHFYTLLPLASVYIKYFRQIIFLIVLILNFLVCINLQNLNNPHTCSVTHFFLFNDCHAPFTSKD